MLVSSSQSSAQIHNQSKPTSKGRPFIMRRLPGMWPTVSGVNLPRFRSPWPLRTGPKGLLEALFRPIRPFELDRVFAQLLGLPGADIADLSVGVIVPTLAGDRIGDRFAKLVGTR